MNKSFLSFKKNFIYLFTFGCAESSLLHGLFSSCSRRYSPATVCRLSCPAAYGIFPDQGVNWRHPALQGKLPTTGPPGKPSVQFSHLVVSDSLRPHESQHARPPCPSPTPGVHSNSCPLSRWCHPAISSSVILFYSFPHSLPASESFPKMSQLFTWGGQSIGVSALASVLLKNTQDWSPLGWTGWISLLSKGLSRVFSNTTVQKHQLFGAQLSSQSNSHIHTWLLPPLLFKLFWEFYPMQ